MAKIDAFYDGRLDYWPESFNRNESLFLYQQLLAEIEWREDEITLFGNTYKVPRLQAWYGEPGCDYTYSGLTLTPQPWTPALLRIKERCEQLCFESGLLSQQQTFNGVLINYYRDGQDTVGWHSDNETMLGKDPVLASVTFGCERAFLLRHNKSKDKQRLELKSGSLLVMSGATQHCWQHSLPRTKKATQGRINLSFRILKK